MLRDTRDWSDSAVIRETTTTTKTTKSSSQVTATATTPRTTQRRRWEFYMTENRAVTNFIGASFARLGSALLVFLRSTFIFGYVFKKFAEENLKSFYLKIVSVKHTSHTRRCWRVDQRINSNSMIPRALCCGANNNSDRKRRDFVAASPHPLTWEACFLKATAHPLTRRISA